MSWRAAAPLGEVRVLDLCRVVSGPFATMQLGDLGADVVKLFFAGDHVIACSTLEPERDAASQTQMAGRS